MIDVFYYNVAVLVEQKRKGDNLETLFAWIANALSIVTGNTPVTVTNRGRKGDSNNPQNLLDANALLKSRLAQAESRNQELEARITLLEKQVQQLQGNS